MKNQECSRLVKEYNQQVLVYNKVNNRVIRNKFEMSYLWKYKRDYPADWRRKVNLLVADRQHIEILTQNLIALKAKIRKCKSDYESSKN
jgi:hypothetical protein